MVCKPRFYLDLTLSSLRVCVIDSTSRRNKENPVDVMDLDFQKASDKIPQ